LSSFEYEDVRKEKIEEDSKGKGIRESFGSLASL